MTVKSNPIKIHPSNSSGSIEYVMDTNSSCILPSSISVQVPDRVQIDETFDVVVTPSFELTQQQIDEYNKHNPNIDSAKELWDKACTNHDGYYHISHLRHYELSGDGVSPSNNTYPKEDRFLNHTHSSRLLDGLHFDAEPTTFQMTIHREPPQSTATFYDCRLHPMISPDYFSIDPSKYDDHIDPVYIHASSDATPCGSDYVILSEDELGITFSDYLLRIYDLFRKNLVFSYSIQ